jgi:ribosomal protein L37AE/L43A
MFECERCGSSYSARHAADIGDCPRCRSKDQVNSPLAFRPFSRIEPRRAPSAETVRAEMTSGRLAN